MYRKREGERERERESIYIYRERERERENIQGIRIPAHHDVLVPIGTCIPNSHRHVSSGNQVNIITATTILVGGSRCLKRVLRNRDISQVTDGRGITGCILDVERNPTSTIPLKIKVT